MQVYAHGVLPNPHTGTYSSMEHSVSNDGSKVDEESHSQVTNSKDSVIESVNSGDSSGSHITKKDEDTDNSMQEHIKDPYMTVEEIEAQPEWYLNKDDNYWVDKHIKELKMES